MDWPSGYRPDYALVLMCHRLMPRALDNGGIEVRPTESFLLIHYRLHRYENVFHKHPLHTKDNDRTLLVAR